MNNKGDIIFLLPTVRSPLAIRQTKDGEVIIGFWQSGELGNTPLSATFPGALQVGKLYSLHVQVRGEDSVTVLLDGDAVLSLDALPDTKKSTENPPLELTLAPRVKVVLERCVVTREDGDFSTGEMGR